MIPHGPRNGQQPEPPGYLAKQSQAAKRERLDKLIAEIRVNRPHWASEPPWIAERFIEGDGAKQQRELFADGGAA